MVQLKNDILIVALFPSQQLRVCVCVPLCVQDSDSVELEGLREDRSYTVELQSVSYWEQIPLKGSKAILRFSTHQAKTGAQLI